MYITARLARTMTWLNGGWHAGMSDALMDGSSAVATVRAWQASLAGLAGLRTVQLPYTRFSRILARGGGWTG